VKKLRKPPETIEEFVRQNPTLSTRAKNCLLWWRTFDGDGWREVTSLREASTLDPRGIRGCGHLTSEEILQALSLYGLTERMTADEVNHAFGSAGLTITLKVEVSRFRWEDSPSEEAWQARCEDDGRSCCGVADTRDGAIAEALEQVAHSRRFARSERADTATPKDGAP
jgi:hypothetical protein